MNSPKKNVDIPKGIIKSLSKYWKETNSGDFQVVVEGELFSCHSYLLESCSEYFQCVFRSGMKENQEMIIELKNVSAATFRLVLKTLYEGEDVLTQDNFLEYWQAVVFLQIPFLIERCEQFAINNLCFDTFDTFKSHAVSLQSKDVLSSIFKFMINTFMSFKQTEGFLKLSFEELRALIKSDELVVDSEDSVILSVFEWVTYGEVMRALDDIVDDEIDTDVIVNDERLNEIDNDVVVNDERRNEIDNDVVVNDERRNEIDNDVVVNDEKANDVALNNEILNEPMDASSNYNDSESSEKTPSESAETVNPVLEKELVSETKEDEPNLRKDMLFDLIKSTRYCLVSERCYANLCQNNLALNDIWVKEILSYALAYKKSCIHRGMYPSAATYRKDSEFEHVAITSYAHRLYAFSFKQKRYFPIANLQSEVKLMAFMGQLYAFLNMEGSTSFYVFRSDEWKCIYGPTKNALGNVNIFIGHKHYMYVFSGNRIKRFDTVFSNAEYEMQAPNMVSPEHALSFYDTVLVFSPLGDGSGVEETSVHSWNTDTNVWDQMYILPFSCQNMVSFYDDVSSYILDSNGSLWKLSNSNLIEFTFLANLWTPFTTPLRGAVLFKDILYLVADVKPTQNFVTSVEDVFSDIHFLKLDKTSSLVHYVIEKGDLANQSP